MKKRVHITSASAISPQKSFEYEGLDEVVSYDTHPLNVIMPDITGYLDPNRVRRMTRHSRMGLMAAMNAMQKAGTKDPGAIIMSTGDGCKDSVARFLDTMIDNDEKVANPTAFIGSTHNSLAGQIAMAVGSNAYNYTYLQRGLSFPSALLDGMLHVGAEGYRNVLVGAADVITDDFYITHRGTGLWKQGQIVNTEVLQSTDRGALAGEGATCFILDSEPTASSVEVLGLDAFFGLAKDVGTRIASLLVSSKREVKDVDLVMLGYNGDHIEDRAYDPIKAQFPNATIACFKPLCGEYYTANAFGTWLAWSAIRTGNLPHKSVLQGRNSGGFKNVLVVDHYQLKDHMLLLLGG